MRKKTSDMTQAELLRLEGEDFFNAFWGDVMGMPLTEKGKKYEVRDAK